LQVGARGWCQFGVDFHRWPSSAAMKPKPLLSGRRRLANV
jgi:hypothetical protein